MGWNCNLKQSKLFCTSIAKKVKVGKTVVNNAIMKYQIEGTFKDRKRSARPRVSSCRDDRVMHKVVIRSPISSSKKIQSKLLERGTLGSTKTIQRRLFLEFGLKSCKPARKPRLTQAMKKKTSCLRQETCQLGHRDVEKGPFFGQVYCTAVCCSKISGLEAGGNTLRGKIHYPNSETPPKSNDMGSDVLQGDRWTLFFAAKNHYEWWKIR